RGSIWSTGGGDHGHSLPEWDSFGRDCLPHPAWRLRCHRSAGLLSSLSLSLSLSVSLSLSLSLSFYLFLSLFFFLFLYLVVCSLSLSLPQLYGGGGSCPWWEGEEGEVTEESGAAQSSESGGV